MSKPSGTHGVSRRALVLAETRGEGSKILGRRDAGLSEQQRGSPFPRQEASGDPRPGLRARSGRPHLGDCKPDQPRTLARCLVEPHDDVAVVEMLVDVLRVPVPIRAAVVAWPVIL